MANAPVEIDNAFFDLVEDFVFADKRGARSASFSGGLRVWCGNDTDPYVGLDGMGESLPVSHHGSVFQRAQANVHLVF